MKGTVKIAAVVRDGGEVAERDGHLNVSRPVCAQIDVQRVEQPFAKGSFRVMIVALQAVHGTEMG